MARYIAQFQLNQPAETVWQAVHSHLSTLGYTYGPYEYEEIFRKGKGMVTYPRFLKISFPQPNILQLEAWTKYAVTLSILFTDCAPTKAKKFMEELQGIERMIMQYANGVIGTPGVDPNAVSGGKPTCPAGTSKADFTRKYLAPSLVKEINSAALLSYAACGLCLLGSLVNWNFLGIILFAAVAALTVCGQLLKNQICMFVSGALSCVVAAMYLITVMSGFLAMAKGALFLVAVLPVAMTVLWVETAMAFFITGSKISRFFKRVG